MVLIYFIYKSVLDFSTLGYNFTSKALAYNGFPEKSTNEFASPASYKILLVEDDNFSELNEIFIVLSKNYSVNSKLSS